jgi:hypothetical protein
MADLLGAIRGLFQQYGEFLPPPRLNKRGDLGDPLVEAAQDVDQLNVRLVGEAVELHDGASQFVVLVLIREQRHCGSDDLRLGLQQADEVLCRLRHGQAIAGRALANDCNAVDDFGERKGQAP